MHRAWNLAIPCWGKVAVGRGKCGLGKVANVDPKKFRHAPEKSQRFGFPVEIPHEIARKISDEIPHEIAR